MKVSVRKSYEVYKFLKFPSPQQIDTSPVLPSDNEKNPYTCLKSDP